MSECVARDQPHGNSKAKATHLQERSKGVRPGRRSDRKGDGKLIVLLWETEADGTRKADPCLVRSIINLRSRIMYPTSGPLDQGSLR